MEIKRVIADEWRIHLGTTEAPTITDAEIMSNVDYWEAIWQKYEEQGVRAMLREFIASIPQGEANFWPLRRFIRDAPRDGWERAALRATQKDHEPEKTPPPPVSADCERIWAEVVKVLRESIPEEDFNTWFDSVRLSLIDGPNYTIQAPSNYRRDVIIDNYKTTIRAAIMKAEKIQDGAECVILFDVTGHVGEERENEQRLPIR
jgi:hypothetical protein